MKPEIETWLAKKAVVAHLAAQGLGKPELGKYSDAELIEWAERIWEARMKYENEHQITSAIKTDEQKLAMLNTIQLPVGYHANPSCSHCYGRGKLLVQHDGKVFAIYCQCIKKTIVTV